MEKKMNVAETYFRNDLAMPPAKEVRVPIFEWILKEFLSEKVGASVVDLGAGPCLFAKKYRDAGFKVTAVDARTVRKPSDDDLVGIDFVESDVRHVSFDGFQVISNLGLLYHLTLEDQLSIFERTPSGTTTVLETQIFEPETLTDLGRQALTNVEDGPFAGALFREGDNPMASWGNPQSFWHTPESMLRIFEVGGFSSAHCVKPHFMSKYASRAYYVLEK